MVAAIVEAIFTLVASVIEAIASLFVAGAEALTFVEIVAIAALFCVELVLWFLYGVLELLRALLQRRKPRPVRKPVLWRPSKLASKRRAAERAGVETKPQ